MKRTTERYSRTWALAAAVAGLSLAAPAQAQEGARLCGRISTQSEQLECMRVVAGRSVDATAVQVCGRISTNTEIVQCARAVAGRSMPTEAARLCGRISTNTEIVECARAVADHTLDAEAARVCGRVSTNSEIVRCAEAIRDKTYGREELALCGRSGTNQGIVQCMRASGRAPSPPETRSQDTGGGAPVDVVNDTTNVTVARIYLRAFGASRWPASIWRGSLRPGEQVRLSIPPGRWNLCIETGDGHSSWWADLTVRPSGERLFSQGSLEDTRYWGSQECHTR